MNKRVVVCMSGGVDSTVAVHLLQEQGYEVEGITFLFWSFSGAPHYLERTGRCLANTASLAARELEIPHHTIGASAQFYDLVLRDFVKLSLLGETPILAAGAIVTYVLTLLCIMLLSMDLIGWRLVTMCKSSGQRMGCSIFVKGEIRRRISPISCTG